MLRTVVIIIVRTHSHTHVYGTICICICLHRHTCISCVFTSVAWLINNFNALLFTLFLLPAADFVVCCCCYWFFFFFVIVDFIFPLWFHNLRVVKVVRRICCTFLMIVAIHCILHTHTYMLATIALHSRCYCCCFFLDCLLPAGTSLPLLPLLATVTIIYVRVCVAQHLHICCHMLQHIFTRNFLK